MNRGIILSIVFVLTMSVAFLTCSKNNSDTASQRITMRLIKLNYTNTQGELGFTTFYYDSTGQLERSVWELTDGSRNSKNYHRHDDMGREVQKYREFSDGITSTNDYEYNEAGQLAVERFSRSDGRSGTTWYEYDSATGHPTQMKCEGLNGWFFGDVIFETDSTGRKIRADIFKDGEPYGTIEYGYDSAGYLNREHWILADGQWSQTFTHEYEPVKF